MDNESRTKTYDQGFIDGWMAALNQVRLSLVYLATDPPRPVINVDETTNNTKETT